MDYELVMVAWNSNRSIDGRTDPLDSTAVAVAAAVTHSSPPLFDLLTNAQVSDAANALASSDRV